MPIFENKRGGWRRTAGPVDAADGGRGGTVSAGRRWTAAEATISLCWDDPRGDLDRSGLPIRAGENDPKNLARFTKRMGHETGENAA